MFRLPDAKRVKREDLGDLSSDEDVVDSDTAAAIQARLEEQLSGLISLDLEPSSPGTDYHGDNEPGDAGAEAGGDEAAFEFRLFSTSSAAKVVLAPEDELNRSRDDGGLMSTRPISYYLRGDLSPEAHSRFRCAAIDHRDVVQVAKQRAWGLETPWKVTHLTISSRALAPPGAEPARSNQPAEGSPKRKRPGKKRRIALRTRESVRKTRTEVLEKQKREKEEHIKEKKKRLNREKKLKRRQKEKEKKLAAKSEAGQGEEDAMSTGSFSD